MINNHQSPRAEPKDKGSYSKPYVCILVATSVCPKLNYIEQTLNIYIFTAQHQW